VFGCLQVFEEFGFLIIAFIPYYSLIKCAIFVWMMSPQWKGATTIYNMIIKDYMARNKEYFQKQISEFTDLSKALAEEASEAAKAAAKDTMAKNPDMLAKAAAMGAEAAAEQK